MTVGHKECGENMKLRAYFQATGSAAGQVFEILKRYNNFMNAPGEKESVSSNLRRAKNKRGST